MSFKWETRSRVLLAAVAAVVVGCSSDSRSDQYVEVVDSLGISIVTNTHPDWQERVWGEIGQAPVVEIGTVSGSEETVFSSFTTAQFLPDGDVLVVDSEAGALRIFAPDGSFVRSFGSTGEGPGEFRTISRVDIGDDGVLGVWDVSSQRLSVLQLDGTLVGTDLFENRGLRFVRRMSADRYLVGERLDPEVESLGGNWSVLRGVTLLVSESLESGPDTLAAYRGGEAVRETTNSGNIFRTREASRVFGRDFYLAISPATIAAGSSDQFSIDLYDTEGGLQRVVRISSVETVITESHADDWIDAALETFGDTPSTRAATVAQLEAAPLPEVFPAFSAIHLDQEGRLWVQEYEMPRADRSRWLVFSTEGAYLGLVWIPVEFEITDVATDRILGVWTDDLGVPTIRVYDLLGQ